MDLQLKKIITTKLLQSIIYNLDLYELVSNPNKHNHANSFIGITLLETTGDYFDLYWDNDSVSYFKNRREVIKTIQSDEIKYLILILRILL